MGLRTGCDEESANDRVYLGVGCSSSGVKGNVTGLRGMLRIDRMYLYPALVCASSRCLFV